MRAWILRADLTKLINFKNTLSATAGKDLLEERIKKLDFMLSEPPAL